MDIATLFQEYKLENERRYQEVKFESERRFERMESLVNQMIMLVSNKNDENNKKLEAKVDVFNADLKANISNVNNKIDDLNQIWSNKFISIEEDNIILKTSIKSMEKKFSNWEKFVHESNIPTERAPAEPPPQSYYRRKNITRDVPKFDLPTSTCIPSKLPTISSVIPGLILANNDDTDIATINQYSEEFKNNNIDVLIDSCDSSLISVGKVSRNQKYYRPWCQ